MIHIIASKLVRRHYKTIRISSALLILHRSACGRGWEKNSSPSSDEPVKQEGSATQAGNKVPVLHVAHVVLDKNKAICVHFATPVLISASGHLSILLVKFKYLQKT